MAKSIPESEQRALAEREADRRFLAAVMDTAGALIIVLDRDGRIVRFNRTCETTSGYTFEEVCGKHLWECLLPPETLDTDRTVFIKAVAGDLPRQYENQWLTKNGEIRLITWSSTALTGPDGLTEWIVGVGIDITERSRVERELLESREQFAGMIASAMDAIITIDGKQHVRVFNAAAEKMFQFPASAAIGQHLDHFIPERFRAAHHSHVQNFGDTNVTKRSMGALNGVFGLRSDGEEFPIEASISQVMVGGEKLFTVIIRDITERTRIEERLREQAALLDHAQEAILVRDLNDRILFWNRGAQRLYGWTAEEAVGSFSADLLYREEFRREFEPVKQVLMEKDEWSGELHQLTKDGKEVVVESHWTMVRNDSGQPRSVLVINTDVTARKRIEAQFLRAQRMESIGTLASGIAHDLNNVLSPILMAIRMFQLKFTDPESQNLLTVIRASAERGAGLVKQVLAFARGVEGDRIALQPRHLIKEVVKILGDTLPKAIAIKYNIAEDLWPLAGDPTQLHQVLMNLCVNARDAMPFGGRLSIEAENVTLDDHYASMTPDARPGKFVRITVSDSGVGIPPENITKIFEPFFTTKDHGHGTGLGLSTTLGIIRSHGGFVNVYSEHNKGTQFKVYIPAIDTEHFKVAEEPGVALPAGHGELILVADDESAIREITKSTLELYGYEVVTAADGTEVIALYAERRDQIKAVILDMMMPYMDGPAAARALQKLDPDVKIVATSGLKANGNLTAADLGARAFISKPYTADKLLHVLSDVLSRD